MNCERCKSKHDGKFGSGRFCSRKCANTRIHTKESKNKISKSVKTHFKTHGPWTEQMKGFDTEERHCTICNEIFIVKIYSKTQTCGDPECFSKLISIRNKGKNCGKNNGMYGKAPTNSGYINGEYESIRFNKIIKYRSSYELLALEKIEKNLDIIDFEYESIHIKYRDGNRTTIPDFLLTYTNGRKCIVEVKPVCLLDMWNNKEKIDAMKSYCIVNGLDFNIWSEEDLF